MSSTIESEKQNRMYFLDVQITHEDKTFTTSVYRTLTFSGVCTDFDNFSPSICTCGAVCAIAYRCL